MSRTYDEESVGMIELAAFIYSKFKKNRYRGYYYKVINNKEDIVWFRNFKDYLLNIGSPSLCMMMPGNLTELSIEIERDKHC